MRWQVVVNPGAGRPGRIAHRTAEALAARGIEADIAVTEHVGELTELVDHVRQAGRRRFVAVGGDGTVNHLVNALLVHEWDEPPVLGILPAGTGCDFVRTFAIPQRLEDAADHLVGEQTYACDVGVLQGSWGTRFFLNAAEAGVGGATVRTAARLPKRLGAIKYRVGFWMALPGFTKTGIDLEAGRRRYEGPAINVVMANGQFFGGGMNVAPRAAVMDQKLDLQVFAGPKRLAVTLLPRIARGLHLSHPSVRRFSSGEFTLTTEDPWPVEADGEPVGVTPVRGSVVPAGILLKI